MQYEFFLVLWLLIILFCCVTIFILTGEGKRKSETDTYRATVKVKEKRTGPLIQYDRIAEILPFWIILASITLAEMLTIIVEVKAGIIIYSCIFLFLLVYPVFTENQEYRNLMWGLSIVPLIRIVSISIPLSALPQIYWYPILYLPLLAASYVIMRNVGLKWVHVGLITRALPIQVIVGIVVGIGFGLVEYYILKPEPLVASFAWGKIVVASYVLIVTTGFVEELIFRGILQKLIQPIMHIWGIIYISLIFAVLHTGFLSILDVLYVFFVALCFAFAVKKTGSLVGVTLSHGFANVTLFIAAPLLLG
jgi:hypothetical protein